jgi:nucleotide-binding universal stress UspA family protein
MSAMKYVVGYQYDEDGEAALDLATWLVLSCGGSLVVTIIVPDAWLLAAGADQEFLEDRLQNARTAMENARTRIAGRVEAEFLVRQASSVRDGLIQAVQDTGASMVVIGAARGGPVGRFFEGSLAAELLSNPPCSVILCPKGYRPPWGERLSRVSIAFSGEPASIPAVQQGFSIAEKLSVPARIVSFIVRNEPMYPSGAGYDAESDVTGSLKEDIVSAQRTLIAGTENTAAVGEGDKWDDAVRAVGWTGSELLIIIAMRHGLIARLLLGSNEGKIIRAADVPCLLLPPA